MKTMRAIGSLVVVIGVLLVFGTGSALAAGGTSHDGDVILGTKYGSKLLPVQGIAPVARAAAPGASASAAAVGDVKTWLALNDVGGFPYLKEYKLRTIGAHVEVWVALNLDFPAADCRNDGVRNLITDRAVDPYFAGQFDGNMFPKMSAAFSSPPSRDGNGGLLEQAGKSLPPGYYGPGPGG